MGIHRTGFSLIELMVVIAIVALLSAVAVPSYKDYIKSAKFNNFNVYAHNLINRSIEFANVNGRYANFTDIGQTSPTLIDGDTYFTNPGANLAPEGSMIGSTDYYMGFYDDDSSPPCGRKGTVFFIANPSYFGFDSDVTYVEMYWLFGNIDGVTKIYCLYGYGGTGTNSLTNDIFPGCQNENTTANWDYNNFNAVFNTLDSQSSCQ